MRAGLIGFVVATVGAIVLALIFALLSRLIPFSLHNKRRVHRLSVATRTLLTPVALPRSTSEGLGAQGMHPGPSGGFWSR
jgi:hypothetical protein